MELSHVKTSHRPKYISCCILKIRSPQHILLCSFASPAPYYRCDALCWWTMVEHPTAWQMKFIFSCLSCAPVPPASSVSACWLQVWCWYRLALEGCCISMSTLKLPLLLFTHPCSPATSWLPPHWHLYVLWEGRLQGLELFASWCMVQDYRIDLKICCVIYCVAVCTTE